MVFAVSCGSTPPPAAPVSEPAVQEPAVIQPVVVEPVVQAPAVIEDPAPKPDPFAALRLDLDAARKNALEQKAAADELGAAKTAAESYLDAERSLAEAAAIADAAADAIADAVADASATQEDFNTARNRYDEAAATYALAAKQAAQWAANRRAEAEAALLAAQKRVAASDEAAQKLEAELLGTPD